MSERSFILILLCIFFLLLHLIVSLIIRAKKQILPMYFSKCLLGAAVLFTISSLWDDYPMEALSRMSSLVPLVMICVGVVLVVVAIGDIFTSLLYRVFHVEERIEREDTKLHSADNSYGLHVPESRKAVYRVNFNRLFRK